MVARKPGRYLAPVALIAVAVAVGVVVSGHGGSHPASVSRTQAHQLPATTTRHTKRKPRYYTVKAGDSLSTISVKTHVPIATLNTLNPGLNPAALQTGQRILLRR